MIERAGEVRINELTGMHNYSAFCEAGNVEYNPLTDRGRKFGFWDGKYDPLQCRQRYESVMKAFEYKYPDQPTKLGAGR